MRGKMIVKYKDIFVFLLSPLYGGKGRRNRSAEKKRALGRS
jgi:hypothetical protein